MFNFGSETTSSATMRQSRFVHPAAMTPQGLTWDNPLVPGHWSQNPWLRLFVGVAVALGGFHAIRRLIEALFLVLGPSHMALTWRGWTGFFVWHGLQLVTFFLGAMVAGSSQPLWLFYGSVLGFIGAMTGLILTLGKHTMVPDMVLLLQICLEMAAAIAGAWLGSVIWKPITAIKVEVPVDRKAALEAARRIKPYKEFLESINCFTLKLRWLRLFIGVVIGVIGYTFAREIFNAFVNQLRLGGALDNAREIRLDLIRDLIGATAVALGGFIAGSGSKNGPAHGIWLAALCCLGVVVHNFLWRDPPLRNDELTPQLALIALLAVMGGFLGSRLMPPIAKIQQSKAPARRNVEI